MTRGRLKDHLRDLIVDLEGFVSGLDFVGPDPASLERFQGKIKVFQEKLESVDEPLFIALVGGTGVGKSALINALAGKVISKSSVKRAFTDHKVFFCHQRRADQISHYKFFQRGVDEISPHHEPSLEDVVLVDLPDIDSDEPSHPQQVNQMIPHADITIWLVDHEKYNDNVLHERYLSALANYQGSFIFVFNRIDELVENKPDRQQARQNLERIVEHFLEVLKDEGYPNIPRNRIFKISAKRALESKRGEINDFSENEFSQLEKLIQDHTVMKQMSQMKFLEDIHSVILELKTLLHFDQGLEVVTKCQRLLADVRQNSFDKPKAHPGYIEGTGSLSGLPRIVEDRIVNLVFMEDFRKALEDAFMNRVDMHVGGLLGFMISFKFRLFSPFYILRQITSNSKGYLRELASTLSGQSQEKSLEDVYAYLDGWEVLMDLDAVHHRFNTLLRDIRKELERGFFKTTPHSPISPLSRDQLKGLLEIEKEKLKAYLRENYHQLSRWEKWRYRQHIIPLVATAIFVGIPVLTYISEISLYEVRLDEILLRIQSMIFSLIMIPLLSYFIEGLVIKRQIRQTVRREQEKIKEQVKKDILKSLDEQVLQPIEMLLAKYEATLHKLGTLEKNFQVLRSKVSA